MSDLVKYGYAPGDCEGKCLCCGTSMHGVDKRAVTCEACATNLHDRATEKDRTISALRQELGVKDAALRTLALAYIRNPESEDWGINGSRIVDQFVPTRFITDAWNLARSLLTGPTGG